MIDAASAAAAGAIPLEFPFLSAHLSFSLLSLSFFYPFRKGEGEQYKSFEREQGKAISLVLHSCYAQMCGIHQIPGAETRVCREGRIDMVFY